MVALGSLKHLKFCQDRILPRAVIHSSSFLWITSAPRADTLPAPVLPFRYFFVPCPMYNLSALSSTCRHCRFYTPEGRRGGQCQRLAVEVLGHWEACALASHPFSPTLEPPLRGLGTPGQTPSTLEPLVTPIMAAGTGMTLAPDVELTPVTEVLMLSSP